MTQRPLLLDLFCGAGGAARGYHDAGFEVVGVDIEPQKNYPYKFYQVDALTFPLDGFDVIHASPVCKGYTNCNLSPKEKHLKLIGEVRTRLVAIKKPYVIENVMGAKRDLHASLMLCGSMFDLLTERHRLFETNVFMYPPKPCDHRYTHIEVYGHSVWDYSLPPKTPRRDGKPRPGTVSVNIGRQAMGISWMTTHELAQAIPPVYTAWIGQFLYDAVMAAGEVA